MKMSFSKIFLCVLPSAFLGLLVGSVVAGVCAAALSIFSQPLSLSALIGSLPLGLFLVVFAVPLGFFVVLLYGIPAYVLLVRFNVAAYWSASIVGVLPGVVLLALKSQEFWPALLVFGIVVALCTHFFAKRNTPLFERGAN